VAAPLMMVGVPLDLPKTSAAQIAPKEGPIVVSVKNDGGIFIRNDPVGGDLPAALARLHADRPDATVYVRGDKAVDYGRIMDVLGKVGQAGFAKISLVAEPAPSSAGAPE
jgi:biopolymer transport protein ExbD